MKELFKGKRYDNGEFVAGYLLQTPLSMYIVPPDQGTDTPDAYEVMPETVVTATEAKGE